MLSYPRGGFVTDLDVYTEEELEAEESYRDFIRPRGLGWGAGTFIEMPTGEKAVFSIDRAYERGPYTEEEVSRLNTLRPHLSRAALIASRLGLERARSVGQALDQLGLPVAVVTASLKVVYAAESLLQSGLVQVGARDRLIFSTTVSTSAFSVIAESIAARQSYGSSFALAAADGRAPTIAHVLPLCGSARDVFTGGISVIILTPIQHGVAASARLLAGLFDLTPTEARVAAELSKGVGVPSVSKELALSRETVRTHLKRVFDKLGVSSQAEMAALLARVHEVGKD